MLVGKSYLNSTLPLLFASLEILHVFCRQLIFFKINFLEKFFQEYHPCVKQLV